MSYANDLTFACLREIQVADDPASEGRRRRHAVTDAVKSFTGTLRTYRTGSLAYGTAVRPRDGNDKGVDGDCGVVLDRTVWVELGPDSPTGKGPVDVVEQVKDHIREKLVEDYPNLRVSTTEKRAIRITFNAPLPDGGGDPPVELIVALRRKDEPGLWIPNLKNNDWDPAHPEEHYRLIVDEPTKKLRVRRARVVRIAKWWNKRYSKPAFSSFNLQALALETLTDNENGRPLLSSLQTFFEDGADSLEGELTEDPAGVSGKLKLQNGVTKDNAIRRLRSAADALADAIAHPDDPEFVREKLTVIFGEDVVGTADMSVTAAALGRGNQRVVASPAGRVEVARTSPRTPRDRISRKSPPAWRDTSDHAPSAMSELEQPAEDGVTSVERSASALIIQRNEPARADVWWEDPQKRQYFERGANTICRWLTGRTTPTGFEYLLLLPFEPVGPAEHPSTFQVWVTFDRRHPKHCEVRTSPWARLDERWSPRELEGQHRYGDERLCLWYPNDPTRLRWQWEDGLYELLGHTAAHLMRERIFLQTGQWHGPERPHGIAWDHRSRRAAR